MATITKDKVATKFDKCVKLTKKGLSQQYNNTDACFSFYNGDMMTYQDRIQFMDPGGRRKRATVNFNRVKEPVDAIIGFMAQNRRQAKYIARVNSSEQQSLYSRNMNALKEYHRENMNADQVETDQDADMVICGYGATETDLSYIQGNATTLPNGEIIKVRIHPKRIGWDPRAQGKNLSDKRWVYYFDDYDLKDALNLFQGSSEEDFRPVDEADGGGVDNGYVFNPFGGLYDKIKMHDSVEWTAKEEDMVRVYNFQWFEYETFYKAKNPVYAATDPMDAMFMKMKLENIKGQIVTEYPDGIETQDMFEFDPLAEDLTFDEATKAQLVKEFGDLIDPVGFTRKCFYTAVISGKHVFSFFKSVSQQDFSVKFKTGVYNEQGKFWTGMVNSLMEPTKYYNKAITEFMFTIASLSKGGVMVEEDAVEDISDFESKWAKTDGVIRVLPGALSGGKIQEKQRALLPNGIDTLITLCDAAIAGNGVNESFLGAANAQETGILYKRRIRQVISKFARYFDSISMYQKEDARLMCDLIRVWLQNNAGESIRVIGEDGADEFLQLSQDVMCAEYDVTIQESPQTPEDDEETAAVIGGYADKLLGVNPAAAMKFYSETLNLLPIDGDIRNRLIKALDDNSGQVQQQMQQMQQQLQQLQAENQQLKGVVAQAEVGRINADAKLKDAQAMETHAKTTKALEEARNKGLENNLVENGIYNPDKVNINI